MMGKIIGIALVGLTQFLLWIVLTLGIVTVFQFSMAEKYNAPKQKDELVLNNNVLVPDNTATQEKATDDQELAQSFFDTIGNYNFVNLALFFLFYFMFGYLMYSALFAAIGSAVDNEADTQQFMLPITVPLIFAFVMSNFILEDPQGPVAFWLSIIPFTSPIVMMIRLPFGVPVIDLILSMVLLVLGFIGTTWLAGKIYRTGILMYGKKVSYRELWKWLSYRS
jgi:ABC-2 type transport system permease protein